LIKINNKTRQVPEKRPSEGRMGVTRYVNTLNNMYGAVTIKPGTNIIVTATSKTKSIFVNAPNVYTKSQVDSALNAVYTKGQMDIALGAKASAADLNQFDELLVTSADVYTKTEVDNLIAKRIVSQKTQNYNLQLTDSGKTFLADSTNEITFLLPAISGSTVGIWYTFCKVNSGQMVVSANSNNLIEKAASMTTLTDSLASVTVQQINASTWIVVAIRGTWA